MNIDNIDLNKFIEKYIEFVDMISIKHRYESNLKHLLYLIVPAFVIKYDLKNEKHILKVFEEVPMLISGKEDKVVTGAFSRKLVKDGTGYKTIRNRVEKYGIDTSHFYTKEKIERSPENIFVENSTANQSVLRRWYERGHYTEYKCAICGLPPEWQGKPLVLTLDHINGKHRDDRLENLRWVCPNCDRQLPTYSKGAGRVDMEE